MNEVIRAAVELQSFCESEGWRFCFIGGLALLRWGEPRETIDVDLTLLTGFSGEEAYIQRLLQRFEPRIPDAAEFALTRRVLLARASSGVGLDIALGGLPFEESAVARSSPFGFPGDALLRTCSAEDLIAMKAFADRPRDWLDVEGVIIRQTGRLDWAYVFHHLEPLVELKGAGKSCSPWSDAGMNSSGSCRSAEIRGSLDAYFKLRRQQGDTAPTSLHRRSSWTRSSQIRYKESSENILT